MVILLSGESADDITVPAEQIKNSGVNKVIVVGIGPLLSEDLKTTASSPQNALMSPDFTKLSHQVPDVIALINSGSHQSVNKTFIYYSVKRVHDFCHGICDLHVCMGTMN